MHSFVYSALPGKVLFGFGTIDKVADEIRQLGCQPCARTVNAATDAAGSGSRRQTW
jgi:hypothetical protein